MTGLRWTPERAAEHQKRVHAGRDTPAAVKLSPAPVQPKGRLQALGRMKPGTMNGTETRYADLLEARRVAGEILWWRFEAMTFKLAHDCRITPDFAVLTAAGLLEVHDVKGSAGVFEDDAKVKMRVLADQFPVRVMVVYPKPKKDGGGWHTQEF